MNLIDRYIYAVTQRLPEKSREDVSNELRANIYDMLPESPSESDIRKVLEELGNPIKLADEYNSTKRYLIGPGLYDNYISVLKLVLGIVISVFASIALLSELFTLSSNVGFLDASIHIFVAVIVAAIEGIMQAFLWVTITFIILERTGVKKEDLIFGNKGWSLDNLPEIPLSNKGKISRGETIFSMFFTILFTALLYSAPKLIGIYTKVGGELTLVEPLFNSNRLQSYIVLIIIFAIAQLIISIYKFVNRYWNRPLAVANIIYNLASCILVYVIVNDPHLFNQGFISYIANVTETSISTMSSIWLLINTRIFIAVFIVIAIWDSINGFRLSNKRTTNI